MSTTPSASSSAPYGVARVCKAWGIKRATFYRWRTAQASNDAQQHPPRRRGPKPKVPDEELAERIRGLLAAVEKKTGIRGEGYRKVWARLRHVGVRVGKERVLRVMRENDLLAPTRSGRRRRPRLHDGTIRTAHPDMMWGTDATMGWTYEQGHAWIFVAVDHCTNECVGIHAAKPGTRYEALEPIHQGVHEHFGDLGEGIATGLSIRHDHGSQYMSDVFQRELRFLGMEASPAFVGEPEGNGIAERLIRTLKEQLLWVEDFATVEELRLALLDFKDRYNRHWILSRHGYRTPAEVRESFAGPSQVAA